MAFKLPNNVQETTTTTGTGAYACQGAVSGALSFASQLAANDKTIIAVFDASGNLEIAEATFTLPGGVSTLSRDVIIFSTNGGSPINWPSGTRNIIVGQPGDSLKSFLDPTAATGLVERTAKYAYGAKPYAAAATASTIPLRDGSGRMKAAAPAASDDVSRKTEIDGLQTQIDALSALVALISPVGSTLIWFSQAIPTGWLKVDGSSPNCTTYPNLFDYFLASDAWALPGSGVGTFTADAGTDVITLTAHGLNDGDRVHVANSGGGLPGGLAAKTKYFVRDKTTNTFKLAATSGGAAIDLTSAGTGTHTLYKTFKLVDPRGRTLIYTASGVGGGISDRALGASGGEETHILTLSEIPNHDHDVAGKNTINDGNQALTVGAGGTGALSASTTEVIAEGSDAAHNNMQPFLVANLIIRY